ncbi:hypothetical protein CHS0354_000291, partial [Potamilus streckersoni]
APVVYSLPATYDLSEDTTAETLLHTINVTDPQGTTVTCSLGTSGVPFLVKYISGTTRYGIYSQSLPNFNYNSINSYPLSIICTDGTDSTTKTFTVYLIKNSPPVIVNLANSTSIPTSYTSGTNVFTVITTDPENDQLSYSMTCNPSPCIFVIYASGLIQLNTSLTGQTIAGYDLSITVTDGKNTFGPKILTVTITGINNNPVINNLPLGAPLSVAENTALGSTVYTVSVTDLDPDVHTWTMTSSPGTGMSYFTLNSGTGVITTSSTNAINYETLATSSFTFTITVSDGTATDTENLMISISNVNEVPTFNQPSYSISYNESTAGTALPNPSFGVSDPDSSDIKTYTLNCGSSPGFTMNSVTGVVSLSIDYDVDPGVLATTVICTVKVTDSGGLTATASLTININNINDNNPTFTASSYSFFTTYDVAVGTTIGTVTATDADLGIYGSITYTLDQTSLGNDYFQISSLGVITTKASLSTFGSGVTATIKAKVTDGGGRSSSATVYIVTGETTTTSSTTTPEYKSIFKDNRNIAWVVLSAITGAAIIGYLFWLGFSIYRTGWPKLNWSKSCAESNPFKNLCGDEDDVVSVYEDEDNDVKSVTSERTNEDNASRYDRSEPEPTNRSIRTVRPHPPPIESQGWRRF